MTLSQIQYFYTLSQFDSYSAAARQLYITQPALSRTIASLEGELGIKLVISTTRKMGLTPAGVSFAETCKDILQLYQSGVSKAKVLAGCLAEQVSIGLLSECTTPRALEFIRSIKNAYPEVNVNLKFYNANGLLKALDDGIVDFIVANGWPRAEKVKFRRFYQGQKQIIMPKDHPLAGQKVIPFGALRSESFLTLSYMISGDDILNLTSMAKAAFFSPHLVGMAKTISELMTRVAMGEGIAIIPDIYMGSYADKVSFVSLQEDAPYYEYLIWKAHSTPWENVIPDMIEEC